jgi:hypothetical protein
MGEGVLFLVVAERGSYSDYTKNNLFLVYDQDVAEALVNALNAAAESVNKFHTNEMRAFDQKYLEAHPRPEYLPKPDLTRPLVPECLDGLPKNKKKEFQIYQTYLEELKAYEAKMEKWREANQEREREIADWHAGMRQAREEFLAKNLHPTFSFPEGYQDKLLTYLDCTYGDVNFSWEQLDLLLS